MFVEAINAAGTAVNAYDLSKKSVPLLKKIVRRIRDGKLNIVVFGAAGTGKTTLGKVLSGSFGTEDILQPYQISRKSEEYQLDSKIASSILVLPGQTRYWDEELRKIANNKVDLIINVVAHGYHTIGRSGNISYQNYPQYKSGMTVPEFMAIYTAAMRDLEIDFLNRIEPYLSIASQRKIVMLTLVTKQDLWWTERYAVRDYYQTGIYNETIQNIQNKLGQANFSHEYISLSLVAENFRSGDGEILAQVAGGYEEKIKAINFESLMTFIEDTFEIEMGT